MVKPTGRVLALLELLQAGGIRTVSELAGQLGVDERTTRRYAQHLRELDIPVEGVRGRYGGYRLSRHSRLPPLMLTDDEALAVVWALLADQRAGSGPASVLAARSASAKLRRVLPAGLARRVDAVVDTVRFTPATPGDADEERKHGPAGTPVLLALAEAARDQRPVTFGYTAHRGEPTQRRVEPHGIVAHRGRLYLSGFDVTRQAIRTFRLDRIAVVRALEGTFIAPPGTDPVQHVLGPFAPAPQLHEISLRVNAEEAHVRSWLPETMASVSPAGDTSSDDGWLRVFLRAERLEWVVGTLTMLDSPFVIERPEELRALTAALGGRAAAVAPSTTSGAAIAAWSGGPGATRVGPAAADRPWSCPPTQR